MSKLEYFKFPYYNVVKFLNGLSDETLLPYYYEYNVGNSVSPANEQLADVISDQDLIDLGYSAKDDTEDPVSEYVYPDVEDIIKFLNSVSDEIEVKQLMNRYDCFTVEDLAVALTDDELKDLGYTFNSDEEEIIDDADNGKDFTTEESIDVDLDNLGYYDYTDDCNDDCLDFLEDIPSGSKFYLLDVNPEDYCCTLAFDDESGYLDFIQYLDPNLIADICVCEDLEGVSKKKIVKISPQQFNVEEDVVINTELNKNIFDSDHKMIPEIKEKIIDYVNDFVGKMSEKDINVDYTDITLVGSNAGYLYQPGSDIDIHLISKYQISNDDAENLFNEFDLYEAENPLVIDDSKVELGIEDGYDIIMNNKATRRYSLVDDVWVDDSDELEQFKPGDISVVAGYEDIVNDYIEKIDDVINNDEYKEALELKYELRKNRSDDLANLGSLSMGNVVFKELRNKGYYAKLKDYIKSKEIELGINLDD